MSDEIEVIYNDTCPICSREVNMYKRATPAEVIYHGLSTAQLAQFGLTSEQAAKEFHVVKNGKLVSGIPAFALLWERIPRLKWLAWLVRRPGISSVAQFIYAHALAPALFAMHRRRESRSQRDTQ